jgi:hypothetical protein
VLLFRHGFSDHTFVSEGYRILILARFALEGNGESKTKEQSEGLAAGQSIELPLISARTGLVCLSSLNSNSGEVADDCKVTTAANVETDFLSAEQVIEITRLRDSEATLVHLGWHELRGLLLTQSVLLVLRNGNVVTALENSANVVVEEIVASDPLSGTARHSFFRATY